MRPIAEVGSRFFGESLSRLEADMSRTSASLRDLGTGRRRKPGIISQDGMLFRPTAKTGPCPRITQGRVERRR